MRRHLDLVFIMRRKHKKDELARPQSLSVNRDSRSPPSSPTSTQPTMDQLVAYQAIYFPADGRQPSVVELMTSPMTMPTQHGFHTGPPARMPHPEVYMDYVADGIGARPWRYLLVESLDGMNRKFTNPYVVFYPTLSRDGMPFPINKCIRDIQGPLFNEQVAWRGNVIIAKFRDSPFTSMIDASMADFPILKNFLRNRGSPHAHQ
ncbi:hypothetical protein C8J57DRAFT_1292314 [Mycena rebaudengoi]|nr:hypothetical protein C8J57DRAFT_1292314 [Mycena rebaudengoi]